MKRSQGGEEKLGANFQSLSAFVFIVEMIASRPSLVIVTIIGFIVLFILKR